MKNSAINGQLGRSWFSSIKLLQHESHAEMLPQRSMRKHCIAVITSGEGTLIVNGTVYLVGEGDVIVLPSGTLVEGKVAMGEPVAYTLLLFDGVRLLKTAEGWQTTELELPVKGKLSDDVARRVLRVMDQWTHEEEDSEHHGDMPLALQRTFKLQRLLAILLNKELVRQSANDHIVGLEYTISYMNEHFMKDLRLEELASMAGLSINHFIRTFKSLMNMTPIKYVEQKRMAKAKLLLLDSGKIKEIARKVGYKDEHYFSRAFKKAEGVAPTLYIKNKCKRIATVYYGLDDYLMTLGLQPVASLSYARRVSSTHITARQEDKDEGRVWLDGYNPDPEYGKLLHAKPDLILTSDRLREDELLSVIAPIAVLKHSNDYSLTLRQVGDLFGKEQEARQWIERYTIAKEEMRKGIMAAWGRQTACFVRVCGSFYRIYSAANQTGSLLHGDLGLGVPEGLSGKPWLDFRLDHWSGFRPDHIFLMTDPTEEAFNRLKTLQQSEEWNAMPAVREGRVYEAGDLFFRTLGPSGRLSAARRIARQLKLADGDIMHRD
ncbi:AraC family transcriptional regulator [Paenibacillus sp. CAU 1782]